MKDRNYNILLLRDKGKTYAAIGRIVLLSGCRVAQIFRRECRKRKQEYQRL
jgi:hypothetical protein